MINSHGMPGQWQPRRLIGNKMNAENLKLRSSSCSLGCEITSVVNTANSSFRVCRTEANLDHVITGRQNNRLLSPPVLWAQWVTSYPKYSKCAQVQYMGSNMWMAAPPMASVWVSLTCSLSLAARWRDTARSRPRRRVAFLTCLIVGQNACDTLMGNRLKIFRRKALYGEGFCGSFSKRHGELAYCVGCTNIFTCLLRLSSGSKYTSQWSTRNNSCFWRTSLALYSRNF